MAVESPGSQESESDRGFVARLLAETQRWQDQGMITAEQARAIASSYDVPTEVASNQRA